MRVLVAGSTGTIGRAVVRELVERGVETVALARATPESPLCPGAELRLGEATNPRSVRACVEEDPFDAVVSCLATRHGGVRDAWRVEHDANDALRRALPHAHFVLLSAICVQKPHLAFQHAKRAFEDRLVAHAARTGAPYSIVRPTAFFKSLSGQVKRVAEGRPFLLFGDGRQTACKPISDRDCARFLADCLTEPSRRNSVLPVGGPGAPITPREQGELLFEVAGKTPRFRSIPLQLVDGIVGSLAVAARLFPRLEDRAELGRIARYYATESMLWWDAERGRYDADATPSFGEERLRDHYAQVLKSGEAGLGDHALFS